MSKFEELKARIDKEYEAVTNTLDAGNSEYAYEWGVLDDLKDSVFELELKLEYEHYTDEEAYKRLCMLIENKHEYLRVVARRFDGQLAFTFAAGLLFSLTNLINEIDKRNN